MIRSSTANINSNHKVNANRLMALKRFSQPVDGTIPVVALLYGDEQLLGSQDNVGIYNGQQKSPRHQSGTVSVTSHRLFYIDSPHPASQSFTVDLACVSRTDHYAGLFTSSPKITLYLSAEAIPPQPSAEAEDETRSWSGTWECQVCAYRNPPGLSPAAARICGLCGVPRDAMSSDEQHTTRTTATNNNTMPRSTSLPSTPGSSSANTALSLTTPLTDQTPESASSSSSIACPACTFLNHPSLKTCELCETDLPRPSLSSTTTAGAAAPRRGLKSAPVSRPHSPDPDDDDALDGADMFIKISFRKGGDKPMYALLKRSLKSKDWVVTTTTTPPSRASAEGGSELGSGNRSVGISAILRTVESSAQGRESNMQDALQDLEALMIKAKDMVHLAAELNEKLTAAQRSTSASSPSPFYSNTDFGSSASSTLTSSASTTTATTASATLTSSTAYTASTTAYSEPEEATFIRSSLTQLGLHMDNAPVTLDMIKDERRWHDELAQELGKVLQGGAAGGRGGGGLSGGGMLSNGSRGGVRGKAGGMMRDRGVVALDEVWGGWNRARGVALIPPQTLLSTLPLLPTHTSPPIHTRAFPSGLRVLHTPAYSRAAFSARLAGFLVKRGPRTTGEVALGMRMGESVEGEDDEDEDEDNDGDNDNDNKGGDDGVFGVEKRDLDRVERRGRRGERGGGGMSVALAKEMIEASEMDGDVCRDDVGGASASTFSSSGSGGGVRWWPNLFLGYVWDGHIFEDDEAVERI